MQRLRFWVIFTFSISTFGLLSLTANAQSDQVYGLKGTPVRGSIIKISKDEVIISSNSVEQKFAVNVIRKITYVDDPGELRRARDFFLSGRYENTISELKKIDPASLSRSFLKQDYEYFLAYSTAKLAFTENGDKKAAIEQLLNFAKSSPNSYHFFEAAQMLGDLATSTGDYINAAKFYAGISLAPWPDYKMKSAVLEGGSLLRQKNHADALKRFEEVLSSNVGTAEALQQKQLATAGKAACLAVSGKAKQGVALIEELISKNDPKSDKILFAQAYNALGACYLELKQPKEALMAYLHTDLLYDIDSEAHAEALYHLGKLWSEADKANRSRQASNRLRSRYPGSVWAALK